MMDKELIEIEGTWEQIITHESELQGHHVRVTILNDKPGSPEVPDVPFLERGSYERILQGMKPLPIEEGERDLWEVILEERTLRRGIEQNKSE